eukprot:scaffold98005_cov17-Tisochrysis_lutea.AAC.1
MEANQGDAILQAHTQSKEHIQNMFSKEGTEPWAAAPHALAKHSCVPLIKRTRLPSHHEYVPEQE